MGCKWRQGDSRDPYLGDVEGYSAVCKTNTITYLHCFEMKERKRLFQKVFLNIGLHTTGLVILGLLAGPGVLLSLFFKHTARVYLFKQKIWTMALIMFFLFNPLEPSPIIQRM